MDDQAFVSARGFTHHVRHGLGGETGDPARGRPSVDTILPCNGK